MSKHRPKLEVLICAYNHSIEKVLVRLPEPIHDVAFLVSHQISDRSFFDGFHAHYELLQERIDVRVTTTFSNGLSNNRNNALDNSIGELILITDDDVGFEYGWAEKIQRAFDEQPEVDVITFRVNTPDGEPFKHYYPGGMLHTKFSLFRVSSIEVALRRKCLIQSQVKFDSNYGLNTKFRACEETVFLSDLRRLGFTLITSDEVIAIHPKESSGNNFCHIGSCIVRGAVIRRVFGLLGLPLVVAFSVKHYSSYKNDHSFIRFLVMAVGGFFSADA